MSVCRRKAYLNDYSGKWVLLEKKKRVIFLNFNSRGRHYWSETTKVDSIKSFSYINYWVHTSVK